MHKEPKCPFHTPHTTVAVTAEHNWWPKQVRLDALRKHHPGGSPEHIPVPYRTRFEHLDLQAVRADLKELMHTPHPLWPTDYGTYGGLFIRLAWHAAGTYRVADGRGGAGSGQQRFAPLNSWPDNANLDKARRLLWPIKQKYGDDLSWADLLVFAGNVAMEDMGLEMFGFGGGREDTYEADGTYWGEETVWLANNRYKGDRELDQPLAAVQMGLIYVNPEGPDGNPDPLAAAKDIRETFARMAMNDEETVALIAGGHTFGKAHGQVDAGKLGPEPEGTAIEAQGLGWAQDTQEGVTTSGLEGSWTNKPNQWDNGYFENLFAYEWELFESPAGAKQWRPANGEGQSSALDPRTGGLTETPIMLTTDLALRYDPNYERIARKFYENPDEFRRAYIEAWYKLTHRDMGPVWRLAGPEVPEAQIWQDPVEEGEPLTVQQIHWLKEATTQKVEAGAVTEIDLIHAAYGAASTYRRTDHRGGTDGGRIRLAPQNSWSVNRPKILRETLDVLQDIRAEFSNRYPTETVSMADMVVIAGTAAVENAAARAGLPIEAALETGRGDAKAEETDVESFAVLEPTFDGFRNFNERQRIPQENLLIERADLLGLTPVEVVVLLGGLRTLGVTAEDTSLGVLTDTPGVLNNAFFSNLLDINTVWEPVNEEGTVFTGKDMASGEVKWEASRADLFLGSHSELRSIAEYYAQRCKSNTFAVDFLSVWSKLMHAGLQRW